MDRRGYSPLPERILSGETTFGEQTPSSPVPSHQARDAQPRFPPRPCACGGPLTSPRRPSGISLLDGSTFSGRLPPSLFPDLQPGEVVDIQNMLRRESSSLSSREVPEHSDGRVFSRHPSAPALPKLPVSEVHRNPTTPWQRRIDELWVLVYMFGLVSCVSNRLQLACRDSRGSFFLSFFLFSYFVIPTFFY